MRTTIIAAIVCLPLFACGERTPEPRGLEIVVSPLTLSGVDEAIYTLEVKSKTGTVWRQEGLRSTRYGDGRGALTYIGTCDASDGANPHTVTLVLEELWADGVELDDPKDFKNPAPAPAGLTLTNITCVENSDTLVRFDLTVLRAARQGFFDIAVEFQDVFCSAKLDCVDELLHYPPGHAAGDGRGPTAVVGFACTAGEDDDDTYLYLNAPRIICGAGANEQVFSLPPNGLPGNQGPLGTIAYQSAIYVGQEAFTEFDKCYWNFAFGIDLTSLAALTPCRIEVQGTASGTPFVAGMSPAGVFPVITWSAPLGLDTTGEDTSARLRRTSPAQRYRLRRADRLHRLRGRVLRLPARLRRRHHHHAQHDLPTHHRWPGGLGGPRGHGRVHRDRRRHDLHVVSPPARAPGREDHPRPRRRVLRRPMLRRDTPGGRYDIDHARSALSRLRTDAAVTAISRRGAEAQRGCISPRCRRTLLLQARHASLRAEVAPLGLARPACPLRLCASARDIVAHPSPRFAARGTRPDWV